MRRLAFAPALLILCGARPEHAPLGLAVGTRWEYAFSGHFEDDFADGRRVDRDWSCTFTDTVVATRTAGNLSVFEVQRTVRSAHPPPTDQRELVPLSGRRFLVIGGDEVAYEGHWGLDFAGAPRHRGTAVRVQVDRLALAALDRAPIALILPLRAGTAWHETSRDRRRDRRWVNGPNCLRALPEARVPAGTFRDCHEIATPWTAADETEISCRDVGMIEHLFRDEAGSARFDCRTTLVRFARGR